MFLMAQFCFLQAVGERWFFFCSQCFSSPSLTELEINFQPLLFQSAQFSQLIPASFCLHCYDVCMSLYRSTKQSRVFFSRADFTLSSLASLVVIIYCHFSLLWERYIHLFWKVFQTLTFGIFCCLYKAFELMSLQ